MMDLMEIPGSEKREMALLGLMKRKTTIIWKIKLHGSSAFGRNFAWGIKHSRCTLDPWGCLGWSAAPKLCTFGPHIRRNRQWTRGRCRDVARLKTDCSRYPWWTDRRSADSFYSTAPESAACRSSAKCPSPWTSTCPPLTLRYIFC